MTIIFIDDKIYGNDMILAYINIFKPKVEKINMKSKIIQKNLHKKEWFTEKLKNGLSPINVINNPDKYSEHYQRILKVDMSYPIIIWKEKKEVIDGNHRLGYAYLHKHTTIKAYILDNQLMKKFQLGKFKNMKEYQKIVNQIDINDQIELFYKNFCKKK